MSVDNLLTIKSVSLWAAGVDGRPPDAKPDAHLLHARLRRRTSFLTRMAVATFAEARAKAGSDGSQIPVIFGSVYGEIATTYELLRQLGEGPGAALSPTKFHNSVHNTAPGYLSIACQNRNINTAITAGWSTLAMGMVEAAALLQTRADIPEVALVVAEEAMPEELAQAGATYDSLAVALVVARTPTGHSGWQLCHQVPTSTRPDVPPAFAYNPCSPALGVAMEAMNPEVGDELILAPGDGAVWMLVHQCSHESEVAGG
ncbi:MAG: beta-ketoacyl synthase chain length factor [Nannocystaceae bacterium]